MEEKVTVLLPKEKKVQKELVKVYKEKCEYLSDLEKVEESMVKGTVLSFIGVFICIALHLYFLAKGFSFLVLFTVIFMLVFLSKLLDASINYISTKRAIKGNLKELKRDFHYLEDLLTLNKINKRNNITDIKFSDKGLVFIYTDETNFAHESKCMFKYVKLERIPSRVTENPVVEFSAKKNKITIIRYEG